MSITFGTGQLASASAASKTFTQHRALVKVTNSIMALITWGASNAVVRLGQISGATINFGSGEGLFGGSNVNSIFVCARLSDTRIVAAALENDGNTIISAIYTVSGTTLTKTSETVAVSFAVGTPSYMAIEPLDSTHFVLAYSKNAASSDNGMAKVCEINAAGTTQTYGSEVSFNTGATAYITLASKTASSVDVYFRDEADSNKLKSRLGSITGTAISFSTEHVVVNNACSFISAVVVDSTTAVITYADGNDSSNCYARVVQNSGVSIVVGTAVEVLNAAISGSSIDANGTSLLIGHRSGTNTLKVTEASISGTTITLGDETAAPDVGGFLEVGFMTGSVIVALYYDDDDSDKTKVALGTLINYNLKALGMSVGKGGLYLYVTFLDVGTSELALRVYELPALTLIDDLSLGSATLAEVDAKTYVAYPLSTWEGDDIVYVYGRMNAPQALANPSHIIKSVDAALTFSAVETGWGSNYAGALLADFDSTIFAIRNTGSGAKLYTGTSSLSLKSSLSFPAGVNPRAFVYHWLSGTLYCAADSGQSTMVILSQPPYLNFVDITYSHPTSNGIKALSVL